MRALPQIAQSGYPVVMDATHSVAQPGGKGNSSGGQREFAPVIDVEANHSDGIHIKNKSANKAVVQRRGQNILEQQQQEEAVTYRERWTDRRTDRRTDGQTDGRTDRWAGRQAGGRQSGSRRDATREDITTRGPRR